MIRYNYLESPGELARFLNKNMITKEKIVSIVYIGPEVLYGYVLFWEDNGGDE